jgi:hypothetical protein
MATGKPDALEDLAEVLDVQGLELTQHSAEQIIIRTDEGAEWAPSSFRLDSILYVASLASSPVMPMMPVVPAADAARAVVGPEHAAARVVIIGIIGMVVAADEVTTVMREAKTAVMKPTMAETAAVKCVPPVEAAAVPATAMETSTMKTSAVEAATMAAAVTSATMSSAADFCHNAAGDGLRDRH